MLQLQAISLQRGEKILFEQADLTLHYGQKAGLVGPNGVGKSSLFKLVQGDLQLDHGEVLLPKQMKIAHIRQDMPQTEQSALSYALEGDVELLQLNQRLDKAALTEDGMEMAEVHLRLGEIGGYDAEARATKILRGLGFEQSDIEKPVNTFSGGWRMRLNLAQVLLARADLLLLDEPTNHLDLEAVMWLEEWLQATKTTLLIISHDRSFLDHVCDYIVHIRENKLYKYTGNYSTFEKEYAMQLALQQAAFEKQQKQRAHMQKFVDRFRAKASKAKQAQSRLKMLEKMEQVEAVRQLNPFNFKFKQAEPAGSPMLQFTHAKVGYGEKTILRDIDVAIREGDRVGLLGPNGAGKSTFIKLLAGELMLQQGDSVKSPKLKVGYFAQHQLEQLQSTANMFDTLHELDKKLTEGEIRRYLGGFHFQGNRVFEPIGNFSGGEKARFVLALIIYQCPNLLLLDEPTNHLDMEMRQALSDALQQYEGAVVLVSHDRYLIESSVDELYLIADGKIAPFNGDVEDYRQWLLKREPAKETTKKTIKSEKQKRELQKMLQSIESKLEKSQQKLKECESALADPALYQKDVNDELKNLQVRQADLQKTISNLESELLQVMEQLE